MPTSLGASRRSSVARGGKEQYLRIQAGILASKYPLVTLELLDRYFATADAFDHAQAYADRGAALKALGRIDEAADAYESALRREKSSPTSRRRPTSNLPVLIATESLQSRYDRASSSWTSTWLVLRFPFDHFLWHAARALIIAARGNQIGAAPDALTSLWKPLSRDESGFRLSSLGRSRDGQAHRIAQNAGDSGGPHNKALNLTGLRPAG
jgi:tetratricopeptide (TPR) repeat protein